MLTGTVDFHIFGETLQDADREDTEQNYPVSNLKSQRSGEQKGAGFGKESLAKEIFHT